MSDKYISVTNLIKKLKPEVDWEKKAKKKAKDLNISPEEVMEKWEEKRELGNIIHRAEQIEAEKQPNTFSFIHTENPFKHLPVKDEPLQNATYLERPIFTHKHSLVGIPDKVEVVKNTINITDIKTYTNIYYSGISVASGAGKFEREKYKYPLDHLDNCNYYDSCLQLSMYMYIIWENNRHLKLGDLKILHLLPDEDGDIIERTTIMVPYMKDEIKTILSHKKKKTLVVKLFDIKGDVALPTDLCYSVPYLKDIIDEYGDNAVRIFRFFHAVWDLNTHTNPIANYPEELKVENACRLFCPDIDIDEPLIQEGLELVGNIYSTPKTEIYRGFKIAMEKLAKEIKYAKIVLTKNDGNAGELDKAVKLYDNLKDRLKKAHEEMMDDFGEVTTRGGAESAYDDGKQIELE